MAGTYSNRTVVITGAGSGLGRAMALAFGGAGAAVACLDRDAGSVQETAATLTAAGNRAIALPVDVADTTALQQAAAKVESDWGSCHVLCANVGVQQFGALDRLTEDDWRWVLDVNVLGAVRTVNAFLPLLRRSQGERHIVLTSSSAVHDPGVRLGAYTTSKFAVMGYGETLRRELAAEGIGVTVLFPAGMATRHLESSVQARPVELGPSVTLPDDVDAMLADRQMSDLDAVLAPEDAIRHLLAELATDPPYIVTHGRYRDSLVRRQQDVLAAYDRAQS